jgi:hypothetical protein
MAEADKVGSERKRESGQVTLAAFIKDNHDLMEVLGVLVALTVFASNLPLKPIGYGLSFMFLTMAVLIWLELWGRFPSGSGTALLFWFENVLSLTILGIVVYWLLDYRNLWHQFLFLLIFLIIGGLFSSFMKRFNVFNRLFRAKPRQRKALRYILGIVVLLVMLSMSFYLAHIVAPSLNVVLDTVYQELRQNSYSTTRDSTATPEPTETPLPTKIRTPTPAMISASGSAATRQLLIKDWGSFLVGLASGLAGVSVTVYLWRKQRISPYRERLYSRQIEMCVEAMNAVGDFVAFSDEVPRLASRKRLFLLTRFMTMATVLPNEVTRPLFKLIDLAYNAEDTVTDEYYGRFVGALVDLTLAARKNFGIDPLSQESLNLFSRPPGDQSPDTSDVQ